jgi:hypothetical protein
MVSKTGNGGAANTLALLNLPRDGVMVCCPSVRERSQGIRRLDSSSVIGAILFGITVARIFLGRTGVANRLAAAVLRIPLPRPDVRRLELDIAEGGLKRSFQIRRHRLRKVPSRRLTVASGNNQNGRVFASATIRPLSTPVPMGRTTCMR